MTHWQVQVASSAGVVMFAVEAPDYETAEPLIQARIDALEPLPEDVQLFVSPQNRHEHWVVTDESTELHSGLRDECSNELCRTEGP